MLFHAFRRSFTLLAILEAVKKCDDPIFFLRLLNRPEHLKPKVGAASDTGEGKPFTLKTKHIALQEARHACVFCTSKTSTSAAWTVARRSAIDHAIPKSRGGSSTINNAQNTCYPCNYEKGTRTTEEYLVEKFGPKGSQLIRRS